MRFVLSLLWLLAAPIACGSGNKVAGQSCSSSSDCLSGICVAPGYCPTGEPYTSFCAGAPCHDHVCEEQDHKCIDLSGGANSLEVCVPAIICRTPTQ